jgi:hypothetical protein
MMIFSLAARSWIFNGDRMDWHRPAQFFGYEVRNTNPISRNLPPANNL